MNDKGFFARQAEECRKLAGAARDRAERNGFHQLARWYDKQAHEQAAARQPVARSN